MASSVIKLANGVLNISDKLYKILNPKEHLYYVPICLGFLILHSIFNDPNMLLLCSLVCVNAGLIELSRVLSNRCRELLEGVSK